MVPSPLPRIKGVRDPDAVASATAGGATVTVGRIVHYHDPAHPGRAFAALVTGVFRNGSCDLMVVPPLTAPVHAPRVPFSYPPGGCCWAWPPRV